MPTIKFKFRSSLNFDSVDIGDRASISVGELKSEIQRHMKLSISSDSCLLLSDAISGQEYKDENAKIQSGSSVIIKRMPAGSASFTIKSVDTDEDASVKATKQNKLPVPASNVNGLSKLPVHEVQKVEAIDFDDFGEDLCAVPKGILSGPVFRVEKEVYGISEKLNHELDNLSGYFFGDVVRHDGHTIEECYKLDQSDLSEDVLGDNLMQAGSGLQVKDHLKLEKMVDVGPSSMQNVDLPSDIKCPLCDSVYKDAVMIPCCQHSFCEKCIRSLLTQKGKCPKCLSAKCRAEDLLPNLSLRQAIEHLLESKSFTGGGTENAYRQYASDGESGIQVKDVCDKVTIPQREDGFVQSSSATGQGSNHIVGESTQFTRFRKADIFTGDNGSHINIQNKENQFHGRHGSGHHDEFIGRHEMAVSDFQGENQPMMEQGDYTTKKKKGLQISTSGDDVKVMESGGFRKGKRACYMCGSLDHLIRDCPVASSEDPMFQRGNLVFPGAMPGYMPPFWNGNPSPYMRPFPEQYAYPGMWPFGAACIPSPAFNVPTYMAPTYSGVSHYGAFMRSGGMTTHYGSSGGHEPSHRELKIIENHDKNPKIGYEKFRRESSFNDRDDDDFGRKHQYAETVDGAYDHRSHMGKETNGNYSDETFDPKYLTKHKHRKHSELDEHLLDERHEKTRWPSFSDRNGGPHHQQQKLCPEVEEDMPTQSSSHQLSEEWHCHHYEGHKKEKERRKCDSDSSRSQNVGKRRREMICANKQTENYHHLEHHLDHSDPERKKKNQNHSPHFRHSQRTTDSRNEEKSINEKLIPDRWKMASGSSEYNGEAHHRAHKKSNRAD